MTQGNHMNSDSSLKKYSYIFTVDFTALESLHNSELHACMKMIQLYKYKIKETVKYLRIVRTYVVIVSLFHKD